MDWKPLLGAVWERFRLAGVTDDLAILEHVAAVLLDLQQPPGDRVSGHPPQERDESELPPGLRDEIRRMIREEVESASEPPAALLDPSALFRLQRPATKGQYPTPRHIVELMLRVCEIGPGHDLLDLACGSGGFLAWRGEVAAETRTVGVEIARRWAHIAYANVSLRLRAGRNEVWHGNALSMFDTIRGDPFDRVVMNPPFGNKVDRVLADRLGIREIAGTTEVVLATLAMEALKLTGRASLLLPAGPLFSNGAAEDALRTRLLNDHHLRMVAALPRDAFQPFGNIQTYLLVADRTPAAMGATWFFVLSRDGYPAKRGRDLSRAPEGPSDFPMLHAALGTGDPGDDLELGTSADLLARVAVIRAADDPAVEGFVIEPRPGVPLQAADWHAPAPETRDEGQTGFVLSLTLSFEDRPRTVVIVPGEPGVVAEVDEEWLKRRYPDPGQGEAAPTSEEEAARLRAVFSSGDQLDDDSGEGALVITADGVLLGRRVRTEQAREHGDPRPETWVVQARPRQAVASSARLTEAMRERQREIDQHLDALSKAAGAGMARRAARPTPYAERADVYGHLSEGQQRVYDAVCALDLHPGSEEDEPRVAVVKPFDASEIRDALKGENWVADDVVNGTLKLLESMGILVRAQIASPAKRGALPYYRLATAWDEPVLGQQEANG